MLAQSEGVALGDEVAHAARATAERVVAGRDIAIEIVVFDRDGFLVGRAPFKSLAAGSRRASPEPAAIIGIVERAVAKIFAPQSRGRPG